MVWTNIAVGHDKPVGSVFRPTNHQEDRVKVKKKLSKKQNGILMNLNGKELMMDTTLQLKVTSLKLKNFLMRK